MRKLYVLLGLVTVVCLLAWGRLRQSEEKTTNLPIAVLVGKQSGYLLTPPEFVAQPFIRRIEWSPDGNYAVLFQTVLRTETPTLADAVMRHRVLLWSRRTRRLSVLWESAQVDRDMNPRTDFTVAFFGKSPACLFAVQVVDAEQGERFWTVAYAAFTGRVATLGRFDEAVYFLTPPADPQAYLVTSTPSQTEMVYLTVTPTGELQKPRPIVEKAAGLMLVHLRERPSRFEDGLQLVLPHLVLPEHGELSTEPSTRGSEEERIAYMLWNPRTNEASAIRSREVRFYKSASATALDTRTARHALHYADNPAETAATWLYEGDRAVLVASDSALAEVAPQGDAILYMAHGAAFYREIRHTSADTMRAIQDRAERERYMRQANQIAKAILMYAIDYDEMFPPNFGDESVAQLLMPYLQDINVFEVNGAFAFRYQMDGQWIGNISNLVETVVGYLELPNGRVVIYADGHVKWQPYR